MGTYDFSFPSGSFVVKGDPAAVRDSARRYGDFATTASTGAATIRSLNSGAWVGDEGDLFRQKSAALPAPLDTAWDAFSRVALALRGFADALESGQSRMATESSSALGAWNRLKSAQADVASHDRTGATTTFPTDADKAAFDAQGTALQRAASGATSDWNAHLTAARNIRDGVEEAAREAGRTIRNAAKLSPTAGQNWFSRHLERAGNWVDEHGAGVRRWIGEHADVIRVIGQVMSAVGKVLFAVGAALATISAVAGFFSFGIGWLGELPASAFMSIGGALWIAGDATQTVADWGEGKIDGRQLIIEGLFIGGATLAGMGIGKLIGKGVEAFGPAIRDWLESRGVTTTVREWLESRGVTVGVPKVPSAGGAEAGAGGAEAGAAGADAGAAGAGTRTVTKTSGTNTATFTIDSESGVVSKVQAVLKEDSGTLPRSQVEKDAKKAIDGVKQPGDQAGHAVAHRFLQDAGVVNMFPQQANFNLSAWKKVENEWGDWIGKGMEVRPTIEFEPVGAVRPDQVIVSYEVVDPATGKMVWFVEDQVFDNAAQQTFDRVYKDQMDTLIAQANR